MLAPHRRLALRLWHMAALRTLRLPPISISPSPVTQCRDFGPMLAPEAAACRGYKSAGSSFLHISGNAMNEEEDEVSSSRNASTSGERSPLVVVSFYKFARLPDYEQKRAPLKELCETNV